MDGYASTWVDPHHPIIADGITVAVVPCTPDCTHFEPGVRYVGRGWERLADGTIKNLNANTPLPKADVPHGTERYRLVAETGLVLKVLVGSGTHGTALPETDDQDYMGICIEPRNEVLGIRPHWDPAFEQYQRRTAVERTGIADTRSGPGDIDLTIYSLRKWFALAIEGNPTVLLPMFVPDSVVQFINPLGKRIRDEAPAFVRSRQAAHRYLGYMRAQRDKMTGVRSSHTNRPELIAEHGFDTKFAMHAIRLGLQGIEFIDTGRITLPIPEPERTTLIQMRRGRYDLEYALGWIGELERAMERRLPFIEPEYPDYQAASDWLVSMYEEWWGYAR